MSNGPPLIVPIVVEGLIHNSNSTGYSAPGFAFLRFALEYGNLASFQDAWPPFYATIDTMSQYSPGYYNGVYLKWRLPASLTRGTSDGNEVTLPLVPNRWIVVRYWRESEGAPRQATGWIIESDSPGGLPGQGATYSDEGSEYPLPAANNQIPQYARVIGLNVPLDEPWTESGASPFLTAVAPGNPAFAVYQPFCNNIFSFFDPVELDGLDSPQELTYCVIGWYSDISNDPLAGAAGDSPLQFDELLKSLNWGIEGTYGTPAWDADQVASWSLYYGFVRGVLWDTEGYGSPQMPTETIGIGFAPTSIQALTNLIAAQAGNDGSIQPDLLAALQLNALHILDLPDGDITLHQLIQGVEFQKSFGGSVWTLVAGGSPSSSDDVLSLLDALNAQQIALDASVRQVAALQSKLYDLWFMWGFLNQSSTLEPLLIVNEDDLASTPAGQIVLANQQVKAYAAGVQQLSSTLNAIPGVEIRRSLRPPFYAANEPVLLLSNAGASGIVGNSPLPLPCRFPSQLVTGFECQGQVIVAAPPPLPCGSPYPEPPADAVAIDVPLPANLCTVSGVPWEVDDIVPLLNECFFLDPLNASTIAADPAVVNAGIASGVSGAMQDPGAAIGTLPDGFFPTSGPPQQQWSGNPWHPILLQWQGTYEPIGYYDGAGEPSWSFGLGGYSPAVSPSVEPGVVMQGQVLLTPAAALNLQQQIQSVIAAGGTSPAYVAELADLQQLFDFVQTNDQWDLVSQSLDGFNEQLLQRLTGVYPHPQAFQPPVSPSVSDLVLNAGGYVPNMVLPGPFQPWRSGKFTFSYLALVDEWGQGLRLINTTGDQGTSMYPTSPNFGIPVLIPPTLLQPARLTFDLIGDDDNPFSSSNPIRGWVVPNLLDQSLLVYDAGGLLNGEVIIDGEGNACWTPILSGSPPTSPGFGDVYFAEFIQSIIDSGALGAFIGAIDATASGIVTTDGSYNQNLALLVGRPLAFVRAQLQFELNGPPYYDAVTYASSPPPSPALITTYPFSVGLGNPDQAGDGLIGYFLNDHYDVFNVISMGGAESGGYLAQIGAAGNWVELTFGAVLSDPPAAPTAIVSMLIDPRLPVHAITGILPVQTVQVPAADVTDALQMMTVAFRVNTITTDSPAPGTVAMATPTGTGTWSWIETPNGDPQTYAVAPINPNALLSSELPVLRRGLLQLDAPFSSP